MFLSRFFDFRHNLFKNLLADTVYMTGKFSRFAAVADFFVCDYLSFILNPKIIQSNHTKKTLRSVFRRLFPKISVTFRKTKKYFRLYNYGRARVFISIR